MNTNQNLNKIRKEVENEVKNKQPLKKVDYAIEHSKTDLSLLKAEKKNSRYALKRYNLYNIISYKPRIRNTVKSLRGYIEKKCYKVITMLLFYIIFLGAILSTPILINHFERKSHNQTEKERSKTYIVWKRSILSSRLIHKV